MTARPPWPIIRVIQIKIMGVTPFSCFHQSSCLLFMDVWWYRVHDKLAYKLITAMFIKALSFCKAETCSWIFRCNINAYLNNATGFDVTRHTKDMLSRGRIFITVLATTLGTSRRNRQWCPTKIMFLLLAYPMYGLYHTGHAYKIRPNFT